MAKLSELRKQAKALGISASLIRGATTASALEKVIAEHNGGGKSKGKPVAKKKAAVVAKKKSGGKVSSAKKSGTAKKSGRRASTPAKSQKSGTAKRSSNSTGGSYVAKGGRNLLDSVDYTETEGWNAREGSAPDRIVKSLRKFKGNRTKVFEALKADVWDFVGKKKANGDKRTKEEALGMLRYRISRTAWDFAMRTGQHEKADNRVEYGTGGTGSGAYKPAKKSGAGKAGKSKTGATKAKSGAKTGGRQKAAGKGKTGAKRGRPAGSKNKK